MTRLLWLATVAFSLVFGASSASAGQAPPAANQNPPRQVSKAAPAEPVVVDSAPTVRVEIDLVRYKGNQRVANQPFVVTTIANGRLNVLRTGAEVPLTPGPSNEKESYKSIGTHLTCTVRFAENGFRTEIGVTSSSLYPEDQKPNQRPSFRTYSLSGEAVLRDGQSADLASATDSITGEVIKAEVTLRVTK